MLREIGKQLGRAWKKSTNNGEADQPAHLKPTPRHDDDSLKSFFKDSRSIEKQKKLQKRLTCAANSPPSPEVSSDRLAQDVSSTNQQKLVSLRELFQEENSNYKAASPPPPQGIFFPEPLQQRASEFNHEQNRPRPSAPTKLNPTCTTTRTTTHVNNLTTSHFHDKNQIEVDAQIANALQRAEEQAVERALFTKATNLQQVQHTESCAQERRVPKTVDTHNDEGWQDYDASLWDSSPPDALTTSDSTLESAHTQIIDSASLTQGSWGEWLAAFSPFGGSTQASTKPLENRQLSTSHNVPTSLDNEPLHRDFQASSQQELTSIVKECIVCSDEKPLTQFPQRGPTSRCHHEGTCLSCLANHIKAKLEDNVFSEKLIGCPECSEYLTSDEIQRYADPATAERFETRQLHHALDQDSSVFRCPNTDCTSIHIHEEGEVSPIVRCSQCLGRFCFRHRIEWHETMSCAEYDHFLANPDNYRSNFERENERVEREQAEQARRRRDQEDHDARFAQSLMEGEQQEEARRREQVEAMQRQQRDERVKLQMEAELRREQERRQKMVRDAKRRQREESANLATIALTTKRCPNNICGWAIEKNDGCAHMKCKIPIPFIYLPPFLFAEVGSVY